MDKINTIIVAEYLNECIKNRKNARLILKSGVLLLDGRWREITVNQSNGNSFSIHVDFISANCIPKLTIYDKNTSNSIKIDESDLVEFTKPLW